MKRRSGFTLIELVVAMVLGGMLSAVLVPILPIAQKQNYQAQNTAAASQAGESIYSYVVDLLNSADRIYLGDDSDHPENPEDWNQLSVNENGLLTLNGATVYGQDYQNDCNLILQAQAQGRNSLSLTITLQQIKGEQATLYQRTAAFQPSTLNAQVTGALEGITGQLLSTRTTFANQQGQAEAQAATSENLTIYFTGASPEDLPILPDETPVPDEGFSPVVSNQPSSTMLILLMSSGRVDLDEEHSTKSITTTLTFPADADPNTLQLNWSWKAQNGQQGSGTNNEYFTVSISEPVKDEQAGKWVYTLTFTALKSTPYAVELHADASCQKIGGTAEDLLTAHDFTTVTVNLPQASSSPTPTSTASPTPSTPPVATPIPSDNGLGIWRSSWAKLTNLRCVSGRTVLIELSDYGHQQFGLFPNDSTEPLYARWTIEAVYAPDGSLLDTESLFSGKNNTVTKSFSLSSSQECIVKITATTQQYDNWNKNPDSIPDGQSSSFTIVFYSGKDSGLLEFDLKLSNTNPDANYKYYTTQFGSLSDFSQSFVSAIYSIRVKAHGESKTIVENLLNEQPMVSVGTYTGDYGWDISERSIFHWSNRSNYSPNSIAQPSAQPLRYNAAQDLYTATIPFFFNNVNPGGLANSQVFFLYAWVWQSYNDAWDVWIHPSNWNVQRTATVEVTQPVPVITTGDGTNIEPGSTQLIYLEDLQSGTAQNTLFNALNNTATGALIGDWSFIRHWPQVNYQPTGTSVLNVAQAFNGGTISPGTYTVTFKPNDPTQPAYTSYNWYNGFTFTVIITEKPQIFSGTVQLSNGSLVGDNSGLLNDGYLWIDTSNASNLQALKAYFPSTAQTNSVSGGWYITGSINAQGNAGNDVLPSLLGQQTIDAINNSQDQYNPAYELPLSVVPYSEGIIQLEYVCNSGQYSSLKGAKASLTLILYNGSENTKNSQLIQLRTLVSQGDGSFAPQGTVPYTGTASQNSVTTLRVQAYCPSQNPVLGQYIHNALLWMRDAETHSGGKISTNLDFSQAPSFVALQEPSVGLDSVGVSSGVASWQADFQVGWSDQAPQTTSQTVTDTPFTYQDSTYAGGTVTPLVAPQSATIQIEFPSPILSTGRIPTPDSLVTADTVLTINAGQNLIVYALNQLHNTLKGNWVITNDATGASVAGSPVQGRDALDLSMLNTPGTYTVTYTTTVYPYSMASPSTFKVRVVTISILVAFTEEVSAIQDRKHYYNNATVLVNCKETLNLYAYTKDKTTYTKDTAGSWTIVSDTDGILRSHSVDQTVAGYNLSLKFNTITEGEALVKVRFTSSKSTVAPLDLWIRVAPSILNETVTGPTTSDGGFTIDNGKQTVISTIDPNKNPDLSVLEDKYLRWLVNDTVIFDSSTGATSDTYPLKDDKNKPMMYFEVTNSGAKVVVGGYSGSASYKRTVKLTLEYSEDGDSWIFFDSINITTK